MVAATQVIKEPRSDFQDLKRREKKKRKQKKKHKDTQGSNDQISMEKEDHICALIPNDGNQDQILEY